MTQLIRNVLTAVTHPRIGLEYASWLAKRSFGRQPVRKVFGVLVGSFNSFSEYHSFSRAISNAELSFLETCELPDGAVVDIGANLGLFSLIVAKRFRGRRIVAFEPAPSTFAALESNVRRNGTLNIECQQLAVSDRGGVVMFSMLEHSRATSSLTAHDSRQSAAKQIQLPSTKLDDFVAHARVDQMALLKIDVEGYEVAVLRGAQRVLAHMKPVVYFEVCPQLAIRSGFRADEAATMLEQGGYSLYRLRGDGSLQPVVAADAAAVHLENWVALPTDAR